MYLVIVPVADLMIGIALLLRLDIYPIAHWHALVMSSFPSTLQSAVARPSITSLVNLDLSSGEIYYQISSLSRED